MNKFQDRTEPVNDRTLQRTNRIMISFGKYFLVEVSECDFMDIGL